MHLGFRANRRLLSLKRQITSVQVRAMSRARQTWFEKLFGFREGDYDYEGVKARFVFDRENGTLMSKDNGKKYQVGQFGTPSLRDLREWKTESDASAGVSKSGLKFSVHIGDVSKIQASKANEHAVFQAASQFNCLEFVGPRVTPEDGVTGYAHDRTQGPACSISAGPATVVRNYFAEVGAGGVSQEGQTKERMINNLADFAVASGNADSQFWKVQGGYTMTTGCPKTLAEFNEVIKGISEDSLLETLRIGVHRDVAVTSRSWGTELIKQPGHIITQVFASATAAGYNRDKRDDWAPFSKLVLKASYEATLLVALQEGRKYRWKGSAGTAYLTYLGGGVFGNAQSWIDDAIAAACEKFATEPLKVVVVQYSGTPSATISSLVKKYR